MKIFQDISNIKIHNAIITAGIFDGVHLGHQHIINEVKKIAHELKGESTLITYWPHPRWQTQKQHEQLKLITTLDEKIEILKNASLDNLIIMPFTEEFSNISAQRFIENIIHEIIRPKYLVIGYNHRFGKNGEGEYAHLEHYANTHHIGVKKIEAMRVDEEGISSSIIRENISNGDIKSTNKLLGYAYFITGKVIGGNQIGNQIGYPTANISLFEDYKLIPKDGVYAVIIELQNKTYKGMLYIGNRPTIANVKHEKRIEVNIFDFNDTIYNQTLKISFVAFVRDDKRFNSMDDLKCQLFSDKETVMSILAGYNSVL